MPKECSRCKNTKENSDYSADKRNKNGLQSACRQCCNESNAKWRNLNKTVVNGKQKARRKGDIDFWRARDRKWYHENKNTPEWKSKHLESVYKWRSENPEKVREINRRHDAKERETARGRLSHAMSRNINNSIRRGSKGGRRWESLVGYTTDQLKHHLEKQFKPGMSWENYGTYWHIDHKIPESAFNFASPDDLDFKPCWALKNLQPMEAKENMRKWNKLNSPFQPSLAIPGIKSFEKRV